MKKLRYLIITLVLMLLVSSWSPELVTTGWAAPALASNPVTLTITNPLPKATTVVLTGTKAYTINVPQGATITKTIDSGKYKYSYQGCLNKAKKGNLKVKGTTATLKIAPCKMATWSFYNSDKSHPYRLRLNGWVDYSVTVNPGQLVQFSWVTDDYQATENWCGKTYNFTWKVKGKKGWIIKPCS